MPQAGSTLPPVFVGGTGRSGTTVVGRLLGSSSHHEVIPVEAKFHVFPGGLPAFVSGKASGQDVSATVRRQWKESRRQGAGLSSVVEQVQLNVALRELAASDGRNRVLAARALMENVLGPVASAAGKRGWVEMTPRVVFHGRFLLRLFPDMRLINAVRDGRDVASSLVAMGWQPAFGQALRWWERRMERAHTGLIRLPPASVMTLRLEDLVLHRREETYARLLQFLGWDDERQMREWFAQNMRPQDAHIGRWRSGLSTAEIAAIEQTYMEMLSRLRARGVPLPSLTEA